MNKNILVKIFLTLLVIECYNLTQCHTQTYLAIASIDRSIVESLLTPGFSLSKIHPYQSLPHKIMEKKLVTPPEILCKKLPSKFFI